MILSKEEFVKLISLRNESLSDYLFAKSSSARKRFYGNDVYIRGLIEISNYCANNCYYCGLRSDNHNVNRYRLSKGQILECCSHGYDLGFRTFVMQGGEDPHYSDEMMTDIVSSIKSSFPDCAITLSLGEMGYDSYKSFFDAGADRYLLRHETADERHYSMLHPRDMSLQNRKECLYNLKEIGYQTGTGFMVGSPYQTIENIADDLLFIHELQPAMVGIGPFIPQHDTPFAKEKGGTAELTIFLLGIIRLMLPNVLLPATTALGTIDPGARKRAVYAGANVIMPNLSPMDVRAKYLIYDNKLYTGTEASESLSLLKKEMEDAGFRIVVSRGDCKSR